MYDDYINYYNSYLYTTKFKLKTFLFVLYYLISIFYLISGYPIEYLIISSIIFFLIFGFNTNDIILLFIVLLSWIVLKLNFNESVSFLLNF